MPDTLADRIYATAGNPKLVYDPRLSVEHRRKTGKAIGSDVLRSRKYFLTDEVVEAASMLGVEYPDVLLAMLQTARSPFPLMWLEWSPTVQRQALNLGSTDDTPERTGAIVRQLHSDGDMPLYRLNPIGLDISDNATVIAPPVSFTYSTEAPLLQASQAAMAQRGQIVDMSGMGGQVVDSMLLGMAHNDAKSLAIFIPHLSLDLNRLTQQQRDEYDNTRDEQTKVLLSHAAHSWSEYWPTYGWMMGHLKQQPLQQMVNQAIVEASGTWRFVVSVIALLQNREFAGYETINPGRRRYVGNRQVPYLQYERVTLKLPRQIVFRKMMRSLGSSLQLPRMQIPGHWKNRHGKGDPNCQHVWSHARRTVYECPICGWEKWFQPSFWKGDARHGFKDRDFVVERGD